MLSNNSNIFGGAGVTLMCSNAIGAGNRGKAISNALLSFLHFGTEFLNPQ